MQLDRHRISFRNRVPNPFKPKVPEMLPIRCREVSDAVVAEGENKADVDDVAKACGGLGGPVPEWFGDFGFVVAELPGGIGA